MATSPRCSINSNNRPTSAPQGSETPPGRFRLNPLWRSLGRRWQRTQNPRTAKTSGFTLTELLVVLVLSSGLIAGLMFLVIELMSTNQRESSREETQRDMQNAIDYISNELREAVYVYEGRCLQGFGAVGDPAYCPGILNYLPAEMNNGSNLPVLAFWRQEELPEEVRDDCSNLNAGQTLTLEGFPVNCVGGHSLALVVYSLSTDNPNGTWSGLARLTRFELSEFNDTGTRLTGYGPPRDGQEFRIWPFDREGNDVRLVGGTPPFNRDVLVDFVDDGTGSQANYQQADTATCPGVNFSVSPPNNLLSGDLAQARSFYACVGVSDAGLSQANLNTEVVLYLRGNAFGRAGVETPNEFLTALESRVLTRGVIQRGVE